MDMPTVVDAAHRIRHGEETAAALTGRCLEAVAKANTDLNAFVHLDADEAPPDLVLVTAEIPNDLPKERIAVDELLSQWRRSPAPAELARIGDEFVRKGERCILIVPSALAPSENNWLLNPQHVGFRKIIVSGIEPLTYDPRMFAAHRRTHRKRQSS